MKDTEKNVEDLKNDENGEDEDLDNSSETVWSICNCLQRGYMKKGYWLICDICEKYICLVCIPKSILNKTFTAKTEPNEVNL